MALQLDASTGVYKALSRRVVQTLCPPSDGAKVSGVSRYSSSGSSSARLHGITVCILSQSPQFHPLEFDASFDVCEDEQRAVSAAT